jgi:hypothetical protein
LNYKFLLCLIVFLFGKQIFLKYTSQQQKKFLNIQVDNVTQNLSAQKATALKNGVRLDHRVDFKYFDKKLTILQRTQQRLEFQRITAQQNQVHLRLS